MDGPSHGSGQADPASAQPPAFANEGNFCSTASTSFACQTDLASEDIEFLKNDYQRLLLENAKLTKSLEEANIRATVSPDSYKSDQKVRYLTGLPTFDRLKAVFFLCQQLYRSASPVGAYSVPAVCVDIDEAEVKSGIRRSCVSF